ncbi:MAG TPA: caspase family protein [Kofleriaceae bacterium]|nr:caspase family protein [Kofleriaceae bacterium]
MDLGLVVGIDDYPRFRSLRGAAGDARSFHTWMCDPDGGGVAPEHARLILSSPDPATPIHTQIDERLGELIEAADGLGGGRRLYFYFSGHGATCPGGEVDDIALLLTNWSRSLARLAPSARAYRGELATIGRFEELVIFLDCCRGPAERAVGLPPTMTLPLASAPCATRQFVAHATEALRPAFESHGDHGWQGVFTRHLLAILRGADRGISARDLEGALERDLASAGHRAHVVNELLESSRFGRRGTPPQLEIRFHAAAGRVRLRDGELRLVGELDAGPTPWCLSLQPGLYKLEGGGRAPFVFEHHGPTVTHVEF